MNSLQRTGYFFAISALTMSAWSKPATQLFPDGYFDMEGIVKVDHFKPLPESVTVAYANDRASRTPTSYRKLRSTAFTHPTCLGGFKLLYDSARRSGKLLALLDDVLDRCDKHDVYADIELRYLWRIMPRKILRQKFVTLPTNDPLAESSGKEDGEFRYVLSEGIRDDNLRWRRALLQKLLVERTRDYQLIFIAAYDYTWGDGPISRYHDGHFGPVPNTDAMPDNNIARKLTERLVTLKPDYPYTYYMQSMLAKKPDESLRLLALFVKECSNKESYFCVNAISKLNAIRKIP